MPDYAKPPFPIALYKRFVALARKYGFGKRGRRWELMEKMLDNAEQKPEDYKDQV